MLQRKYFIRKQKTTLFPRERPESSPQRYSETILKRKVSWFRYYWLFQFCFVLGMVLNFVVDHLKSPRCGTES